MVEPATHRIWIAGNYDDAVRTVREWCDGQGDCYSVMACDYVYSGGCEAGVCVTRIHYARFPEPEPQILNQVKGLGEFLAARLFQKSYSIETPSEMLFITRDGPWNG